MLMKNRVLSYVAGAFLVIGLIVAMPAVALADEIHIVQPGETLSEIAKEHGTSVEIYRPEQSKQRRLCVGGSAPGSA